ncbi:MAG: hypothetical protein JNM77_05215 [Pseudonocardia sp.]|nr:hypothetical protein [Pseudonocardia sp.]
MRQPLACAPRGRRALLIDALLIDALLIDARELKPLACAPRGATRPGDPARE